MAANDNVISSPVGYVCFTNRTHANFLLASGAFARYSLVADSSRFRFSAAYHAAVELGNRFRAHLVNESLRDRFLDAGFDADFEYVDQPFGASSRLVYSVVFDTDDDSVDAELSAPVLVSERPIDIPVRSIAGNLKI